MKHKKQSTDCYKCGEAMRELPKTVGYISKIKMVITGYLCKKCGHWNDLKRRKGMKSLIKG